MDNRQTENATGRLLKKLKAGAGIGHFRPLGIGVHSDTARLSIHVYG